MTMMGASMGGPGMPPLSAGPGGMPPQDPQSMILQMLQALMQKWSGAQTQVAGEQGGLVQMMMQLLQSGAPSHAESFAEPSTGPVGLGMNDTAYDSGPEGTPADMSTDPAGAGLGY